MIIEFRCERDYARQWMSRETLSIDGRDVPVRIVWAPTAEPRPAGLDALFELERVVLRKGKHGGADRLKIVPEGAQACGAADIIVDFTGAARDPDWSARLYLRPLFNGAAGENAALAAILAGDLPVIGIVNEVDGSVLDRGHPSGEIAAGLSGALETVMARTLTMVAAVLSGRPRIVPQLARPAGDGLRREPVGYVARGLAASIAKEIYRLCCYAPHWHIGWRVNDGGGVWQTGDLSGPSWNVLGDPGNHFYADPFPISWQGRTFVFFEDLDHRVGKGIISAIEFSDAGPVGEVMPVLEEPWHLSYPFLIEDDGELWMIPESSTRGDVALYKCVRFPDKWERYATLLSGLELADATITRHNRPALSIWRLARRLGWLFGFAGDLLRRPPLGALVAPRQQSGLDRPRKHAAGGEFRHPQWQIVATGPGLCRRIRRGARPGGGGRPVADGVQADRPPLSEARTAMARQEVAYLEPLRPA
ncbi:hypothetical protein ACVMBZ_001206 [Bradyrhizobium liaoningense]